MFGPYWSVTRYNDIMEVDTNHSVFSSASALGGITIRDIDPDLRRESFISMDPPKHDEQRKTVSPIVRADATWSNLAPMIRERVGRSSTACRAARRSTGSTRSRSS